MWPMARVVSINVSPGGIPKRPVPEVEVAIAGLVGDGHDHEKHRTPVQAVSLLDLELLRAAAEDHGLDLVPGSLGENLTVQGLGVQRLGEGDRLRIDGVDGRDVLLEITKVRPPCYVLDALSPDLKRTMWNRIGMYAAVIEPGVIREGARVTLDACGDHATRPLHREPKSPGVDGAARAADVLRASGLEPIDPESAS
jgi:MOSC domain-containing protein YiiM